MLVVNNGTVWSFSIQSAEERAWVKAKVHVERWQWHGKNTFVVDHRCGAALAVGMQAEGLEVSDGAPKPPSNDRRQARNVRASS